ncbi:MAG: hypothetical protein ACXIVQ_14190 [Acidimicrobiales bacterium]
MTRTRFSVRALVLVAVGALGVSLLVPIAAASAAASDTCKDQPGFSENLEGDTSGVWGTISFTPDRGPLVLDVNDGYVVHLCLKKGSSSGASPYPGVQLTGPYVGPIEGLQVYYPGTTKGFSHYAVRYEVTTTTTVPEETTTTTVAEETTTTTVAEETTTTTEDVAVLPTIVEATTTTAGTEATTTTTEDVAVLGATELPRTGVGSLVTALVGALLVTSGGTLLVTARRRGLTLR